MKNKTLSRMAARAGAVIISAVLLTGFVSTQSIYADETHSEYAGSSEMGTKKEIKSYGMTPIAGSFIQDGTWEISVRSSSSFFRIHSCQLVVEEGSMEAKLTMETYSYPLLFAGTAKDAAAAPADSYIEYEDVDDWYVFTIPVQALNTPIDCAAFSKKKEKWYDRQLLFDASSLSEEALNGLELPDYELIEKGIAALNSGESASSEDHSVSRNEDAAQTQNPVSVAQSDYETEPSVSNNNSETIQVSNDKTSSDSKINDSENKMTSESEINKSTQSANAENNPASDYDNSAYAQPTKVNLPDGNYSINVALTGGSGRASVSTPTLMTVKDGKAYAQLLWSSSHYDWMQIGGVTYKNEAEEGANSVFTVPISAFDSVISVIADTTAMGDPVAIQYSLTFYQESIGDEGLIPQIAARKVVILALIIIVAGFFLNLFVKKKRKR